jgi:NAD(P)H-dependent FMN reductase
MGSPACRSFPRTSKARRRRPPSKPSAAAVARADGLVIACPEYVRALPGGFKNAVDWLVSRDEIIVKPIALIHASHRGDDMLEQLRLVLGTVSETSPPISSSGLR